MYSTFSRALHGNVLKYRTLKGGPSPQRPRAHHDLVSAVSIVECLLCDSEHTGFAESVCDHLSQFDVARARRVSSRSLLSLTAIV